MAPNVLLIACGALARELVLLVEQNGWQHLKIQCLPAELHNSPQKIPAAVMAAVERYRNDYRHIFVAYADCGTGGQLDKVLAPYGIERLAGAHCYEFFTGPGAFAAFCDSEPGTFYLTDFLVRHFERLVIRGLGLDRHPELKDEYFGNYTGVIYLAQSRSAGLSQLARQHAHYLGLPCIEHFTGLDPVNDIFREHSIQWQS